MPSIPKILYVEDDDDLLEITVLTLKTNFQCEIIQAKSGNEAISILLQDGNFDLIISDFHMQDGTGEDLYNFIKKQGLKLPFVILSSKKMAPHSVIAAEVRVYKKPLAVDEIIAMVKENLGSSAHHKKPDAFIPVSISLLEKIKEINASLHIKLSDEKFVKVYYPGAPLSRDIFEKFKARGVDTLFIENLEVEKFISGYRKDVFSDAAWSDAMNDEYDNSFKLNTELLRRVGPHLKLSEALVEMTRVHMEAALKIASKSKKIKQVLQKFNSVQNLAFADHCLLIVHIAGLILSKINPSGLEHNLRVISLAAILHDVSLDDRLYELKLKLLYAAKLNNLEKGGTDQAEIFQHPMKAADFSKGFDFCHPEVEQVVGQHHELPDGTGFPLGLQASQLHPLSALFIVAEDFVDYFIRFYPKPVWKTYVTTRRPIFKPQHFYDAFSVLVANLPKD